jgi:hypothetical protein
VDSQNVRFEPSYPSVVQRLVNYAIMLHTRCPPRIPIHALHNNDLDTIKVDVESWEVEDGFPCA